MPIVPYPDLPNHATVELQEVASTRVNRSLLSGARQALDLGYSWWEASVSVAPMDLAAARTWRVFFGRLRGPVHSFRLPVTSAPQHDGSFTVRAAGAGSGYSLETDGWPPASQPVLAGDYVTVGDQLMVLDEDPVIDGAGLATLAFHSPLRGAVADNTIIETKSPWLLAYLPDGAPARRLTTAQLQDGFAYSAMEAY